MELDTIVMDPETAKARAEEYRRELRVNRRAEDARMAVAYRAAARGLPLVKLSEVMAAGGWFPDGLPRLAICRADFESCVVEVETWWARRGRATLIFGDSHPIDNRGALVGEWSVRVEVPATTVTTNPRYRGTTVVPHIPPRHRPRGRRMHRLHVLWEVESWSRVPPRDPALLAHVGGDLWAVLAVWDLTDLERAVIAGRFGR